MSRRKVTGTKKASNGSLRRHKWPRFLRGPDREVLEKLYIPALGEAVRYDRCCAYFSSSVLAAAARGFAKLIERLLAMGDDAPRPAVRLVVNEELSGEDVRALMETGDTSRLEETLRKRFTSPKDLLVKQRLAMLGWLAKQGWLEVRVGVMRQGQGIVHAKFGLIYDSAGNALVFNGSGNESAHGLVANYERLEVSTSWNDQERHKEYQEEFEALWKNIHPHVFTVTLPEAILLKLIRYAPPETPVIEPADNIERRKAAMLWRFIAEAPYLPNGASCCEATAPLEQLWPHQIRVIEEVTNSWPEGRLLCDEVGMGKTIEAIMIMRRLLAGRGVRRVLLLLPAGLCIQWQEELREKGGLIVPRLQGIDTLVWPDQSRRKAADLADALKQDILIMSRETARMESNRGVLLNAEPWDLVLLDEAHAARRARQEEGEFNSATLLLELLRQLQVRGKARSFLFLSATPMQTEPWEPWDLLAVLGEGGAWLSGFEGIRAYYSVVSHLREGTLFEPSDARQTAWLVSSDDRFPEPPQGFTWPTSPEDGEKRLRFVAHALKPTVAAWLRNGSPLDRRMHRNTRKTLKGYYQQRLVACPPPARIVNDVSFDYQPADGPERKVYDAVGSYIDRRFDELEEEKPGKGFVMTIYRRRAASSPHALKHSLERRLGLLKKVLGDRAKNEYIDEDESPAGILDTEVPPDIDPRSIPASVPSSPAEARREADEVEILLNQLNALGNTDTKRDRFFDLIRTIVGEGRPVLIFTEYTDTMDYIRDHLAAFYGDKVGSFSGSGGAFFRNDVWTSATKKEITDALDDRTIQFLVCTDAASEGLNLQSASALINYDLPWNPSRVEQRIGRIDRIGQREREVKIYNLLLKDSIDERVYKALEERCGIFTHFVGPMQPVLARAREMLNRPKEFSLDELQRRVSEVEKDVLSMETYLDSDAAAIPQISPPVTKGDIRDVLEAIRPEFGLKVRLGKVIMIKGLNAKSVRIALDSDSLDTDTKVMPLTVLSPIATQVADHLSRPGEFFPLVIGSNRSGAFRSTCAVWVGSGGLEPVESIGQLKQRLGSWDGTPPDTKYIEEASRYTRREAERTVRIMESRAMQSCAANSAHQRKAAMLRTTRELGRLLKCLDSIGADMSVILETHANRPGALAARIKEAGGRLGGGFMWTPFFQWELSRFIENVSPNDQRSRLTGSSLEAALNDYRW